MEVRATATERVLWVTVRGEADLSNHDQLVAALGAIAFDGVDEVYVDLGDLLFCDVRSIAALVAFARRARNGGRVTRFDGASGVIRRAVRLLGGDEDPLVG
ncbi:MAG TPA: STAS domain-containing protein [Nocardioidaceae bacterium]